MICFKDMTFCADADHCKNRDTCARNFDAKQKEESVKWWGGADAPIAFSHFAEVCKSYEKDSSTEVNT